MDMQIIDDGKDSLNLDSNITRAEKGKSIDKKTILEENSKLKEL